VYTPRLLLLAAQETALRLGAEAVWVYCALVLSFWFVEHSVSYPDLFRYYWALCCFINITNTFLISVSSLSLGRTWIGFLSFSFFVPLYLLLTLIFPSHFTDPSRSYNPSFSFFYTFQFANQKESTIYLNIYINWKLSVYRCSPFFFSLLSSYYQSWIQFVDLFVVVCM